MIDVFIRGNYTADSNAMMSGFLNEFADAEDAVGDPTKATALRKEAVAMVAAMNAISGGRSNKAVSNWSYGLRFCPIAREE